MSRQRPVESLSFEEALVELESIVKTLETGQAPLEESISSYERGTLLKHHCEAKLRAAQAKIEKITVRDDGSVSTQPLDPEE
ncbi:MAG: exodeoxyribonuclease VII small subunit [Alphaproteobacteria bacterium]|nr:exodeoxyribonuclease VII small subunit [Alphaproteobacteria bacterium]